MKFVFKTDHEPIRYFQSKARLTGRQAQWLDELQSYSCGVEHVPGSKHVVPDALNRREDHNPAFSLKITSIGSPNIIDRIKQ